jgi:hypothetical protein
MKESSIESTTALVPKLIPRSPTHMSYRMLGWVLLAALAVHAGIGLYGKRPDTADDNDSAHYIAVAYNIAHHGTFSPNRGMPPEPAIGREPGYPLFLAALMSLDPGFGRFTLDCLSDARDCRALYVVPQWVNVGLVAATGVLIFLTVHLLSGSLLAAWVAGAHVWLNYWIYSVIFRENLLFNLLSDPLALFLAALTSFAFAWAWRRGHVLSWAAPAAALAALTLTKAIFLYLAVPLLAIVLLMTLPARAKRRQLLTATMIAAVVYALPVGGWMARNQAVAGDFTLTTMRGGSALAVRDIYNQMTARQYAAAFVYWTPVFGHRLARWMFSEETLQPFDSNHPDSFYRTSRRDYKERIHALRHADPRLSTHTASAEIESQLIASILSNLPVHVLTTLPLFYRGMWEDLFIVFSLPALVWLAIRALRLRVWLLLLILSPGLFSLAFYSLFSLNITRYQMTAMPVLGIALGFVFPQIIAWLCRKP